MRNKKIFVIALLLAFLAGTVFAVDVKIGKYVVGDSRSNLDYNYWIELRVDRTAVLAMPGGSASGTWRYDGYKIYITLVIAYGEMAYARGMTLEFTHIDATGNVIYGEDDAASINSWSYQLWQ
jgi:hypothetical protein